MAIKKTQVKEVSNMNIGIDSGFGYGIAVTDDKKIIIPSFITEVSEREAKAEAEDIKESEVENTTALVVKLSPLEEKGENKFFFVGDLVTQVKPDVKRELTTLRINNEKHLVQILTLIGLSSDEDKITVNLGMGLPNKLKYEATNLKKWLSGTYKISFLYKDMEVEKTINIDTITVLSQSVACIFSLPEEEYVGEKIISEDMGHYTKDSCLWTGRHADDDFDACGNGFFKCYKKMQTKLLKSSNIREITTTIKEKNVQEALETGSVTLRNGTNDVREMQREVLEDYAKEVVQDVVTEFESIFDDIKFLLLSGGVVNNKEFVEMVKTNASDYGIEIKVPDEPQLAVAKGLYNFVCKKFE